MRCTPRLIYSILQYFIPPRHRSLSPPPPKRELKEPQVPTAFQEGPLSSALQHLPNLPRHDPHSARISRLAVCLLL